MVSIYLIWILESRLIRSNKPIKSNFVSSGNVSHCRTPSINDHFRSLHHCLRLHKTKLLDGKTGRLREHNQCYSTNWSSLELFDFCKNDNGSPGSISTLNRVSQNRNHQIPQLESRKPVGSQSNVQRDDFCFCWTVWNWGLFLTDPTYCNKYDFQIWQCSSTKIFQSSRSPARSRSWNSPKLHCLAVLPTWQCCSHSHVWWM